MKVEIHPLLSFHKLGTFGNFVENSGNCNGSAGNIWDKFRVWSSAPQTWVYFSCARASCASCASVLSGLSRYFVVCSSALVLSGDVKSLVKGAVVSELLDNLQQLVAKFWLSAHKGSS